MTTKIKSAAAVKSTAVKPAAAVQAKSAAVKSLTAKATADFATGKAKPKTTGVFATDKPLPAKAARYDYMAAVLATGKQVTGTVQGVTRKLACSAVWAALAAAGHKRSAVKISFRLAA